MVPFLSGQHERLEKKFKKTERLIDRWIGQAIVKINRFKKLPYLSYDDVESFSREMRAIRPDIEKDVLKIFPYNEIYIFVHCFLDKNLSLIMDKPGTSSKIPFGRRIVVEKIDDNLSRYIINKGRLP